MKKTFLLTLFIAGLCSASFATIHTISVANFSFTPSSLSIDLGDTVRFQWVSGTHPVASDTIGDWTTVTLDGTINTQFDVVPSATGAYPYYCVNHGAAGGTGMSGVFTVNSVSVTAPVITSEPANDTITEGGNASFSVIATDATGYQWQENTGSGFTNVANGGIYSGATAATLNLTAAPLANNGFMYRCIVTGNTTPNDTSSSATLVVNALPTNSTATIMVEDFQYVPDSVHIELGDTVRFQWVSGVHPTASPEGTWATFMMNSTDTEFDLVLTSEGTYIFYCTNHGDPSGTGMSGKIVVGDPQSIGSVLMNANTFVAYPNPTVGDLNVIHNYPQLTKIVVLNAIGEQVLTFDPKTSRTLSLASLESGIYFVKAMNGTTTLNTVRIVKK